MFAFSIAGLSLIPHYDIPAERRIDSLAAFHPPPTERLIEKVSYNVNSMAVSMMATGREPAAVQLLFVRLLSEKALMRDPDEQPVLSPASFLLWPVSQVRSARDRYGSGWISPIRPHRQFTSARIGEVKAPSTWKLERLPNDPTSVLYDSGFDLFQVCSVEHH